jgi:uncharacterized protein (UPF0335 family)
VLSAAAANVTMGSDETTANRLRASLQSMFGWVARESLGWSTTPSSIRTDAPNHLAIGLLVAPETSSIEELAGIWKGVGDSAFSDVVRLLILTGKPPGGTGRPRRAHDRDATASTRPSCAPPVERIEAIKSEHASLAADVRSIYYEAKSNGFDVAALRQIIKMRNRTRRTRRAAGLTASFDPALGSLGCVGRGAVKGNPALRRQHVNEIDDLFEEQQPLR